MFFFARAKKPKTGQTITTSPLQKLPHQLLAAAAQPPTPPLSPAAATTRTSCSPEVETELPGRGEYAKQRSDIGTPFSCAGSLVPCTHDSLLVPPPPSPFFLPPPLHRSSLALTHPSTSSPIKSRRRRRRFESTSAKKIDSVCETNQQTQRRTKSSH